MSAATSITDWIQAIAAATVAALTVALALFAARQIKALHASLRAYVLVDGYSITPFAGGDGRVVTWRVGPKWENAGQTPALHLKRHSSFQWFPSVAPPDFRYPDQGPSGAEYRTVFGTKGTKLGPTVDIPTDLFQRCLAGNGHLYLWGWAEYQDVLGTASNQRTEFYVEIIVTSDPTQAGVCFDILDHERPGPPPA